MINTPEPMKKVRIAVPKSLGHEIIDSLYDLHVLHVKHYKKGSLEGLDTGSPLGTAEELSKTLITLRSLKDKIGIEGSCEKINPEEITRKSFISQKKKIEKVYAEACSLLQQKESNEKIILECEPKIKMLRALKSILGKEMPQLKLCELLVGKVKNCEGIENKLKERLNGVTPDFALNTAAIGDESLIAVVVSKKDKEKADSALKSCGVAYLNVKEYQGIEIKTLEKLIADARKKIEYAQKRILEIKKENLQDLPKIERILEEEVKKAELPLKFATTSTTFIAEGYVPEKQLGDFKKSLGKAVREAVIIEELQPSHNEEFPVKLNNRYPVKSFEALTRLYDLPRSIEADPSALLFLTFPFFFGIMLGDVGYGLSTFFIFRYIRKRFASTKDFMNVLLYASIVTIVFGFVFGEFFGFEYVSQETGEKLCSIGICFHKEIIEHHGNEKVVYSFPRIIGRMSSKVNVFGYELLTVLVAGIIIGFLHLNFGLLVGFYNVKRAHGLKHAILEKLSWLILEAGAIISALSLLGISNIRVWVGATIFAASLVMLYLGEGPKGIIEVPAIFSNMLSYMRLGAVGLASVGLAIVINENLAMPFLEKGGVFIFVSLIIMVVGHLINIGLGVLGPFLHGIRLHYVEFFSKFFSGGGQEYEPFGLKTH